MIVQCPDCATKMKLKLPAGMRPGQKVQVACRCGTKLRFDAPRQVIDDGAFGRVMDAADTAMARQARMMDALFGGRSPLGGRPW